MSFSEGQFIDEFKNNAIPNMDSRESLENTVTAYREMKYQNIWGFGGAFTDSATMNIRTLKPPTQELLLR